jgi:hypothetical protein
MDKGFREITPNVSKTWDDSRSGTIGSILTSKGVNEMYKNSSDQKNMNNDEVNNPKHYNSEVFPEVIDMMVTLFGVNETMSFCKLNSFKYRLRTGLKNVSNDGITEDVRKAIWYEQKYEILRNTQYEHKNTETYNNKSETIRLDD